MIKVDNISKKYGSQLILNNISFEINDGEIVVIIGKSGSGKSTLLRCIEMIKQTNVRKVFLDEIGSQIDSKAISIFRKKAGMVFQQFNLFNNMTVMENITLAPIKVNMKSKEEAEKEAIELLSMIGLKDKANTYPNKLSGGEQQRIAIIRALAMHPKYLLLDEITSALDPEMVKEVLQLIKKMAHNGMTMLIVTHEMAFAKEIANKIIYIDDGKIKEIGLPKQIFEEPKDESLRSFLDKIIR